MADSPVHSRFSGWPYHAGVTLTSAMLIWHGSFTAFARELSQMVAGIAGLGRMLITAGMIIFFVALRRAITPRAPARSITVEPERASA